MEGWIDQLKKQNSFTAYMLIAIGLYFLLKQLDLPLLSRFSSWPTLLILIGLAFLIHSYTVKEHSNLFSGALILLLGIHFHGLQNYPKWIDHWAVFPLIIGITYIVRYLQTKKGLIPGLTLIIFSSLMIFSIAVPTWLNWVYQLADLLEKYWPIAIIILGLYLLKKK